MKRNKEVGTIGPVNLKGPKLYNIDRQFLVEVERQNLYEKFDKLKGADAIYAMVAYIENMTLVTMDNDFDKVANIIKVMKL
jgi:predicted nucleic acid-binding protein